MKLYNKLAYHSTSQKGLKEFRPMTDDEVAYKGEGAMIHGYGLYLQEDKELNIENYKDALGDKDICEMTYDHTRYMSVLYTSEEKEPEYYIDGNYITEDDFEPIDWKVFKAMNTLAPFNGNVDDTINNIGKAISQLYGVRGSEEYVEQLKNEKEFLESLKNQNIDYVNKTISSSQYTVEIPDDMVLLDEDKWIYTQDEKIQSIVKQIVSEMSDEQIQTIAKNISDNEGEDFILRKGRFDDGKSIHEGMEMHCINGSTGSSLYYSIIRLLVAFSVRYDEHEWMPYVSKFLSEHGIDGIKYYGNSDGDCYVIFNCSKLKIIKEE